MTTTGLPTAIASDFVPNSHWRAPDGTRRASTERPRAGDIYDPPEQDPQDVIPAHDRQKVHREVDQWLDQLQTMCLYSETDYSTLTISAYGHDSSDLHGLILDYRVKVETEQQI